MLLTATLLSNCKHLRTAQWIRATVAISFLLLQNPLPFEGGSGDGIIVTDTDAQAQDSRWLRLVAATPSSCAICNLISLQGAKRVRDEVAAKNN